MNMYHLKGTGGFDSKFPFDCVVILKDLLSNKVIIINALLITFQKNVVHLYSSIASNGLQVWNEGNVQEHVMRKYNGSQTYLQYD